MPDSKEFRFYGPARAVRGGIKAQTKRGEFGKSWWGRRWLTVLEGFDIGGRLDRGKAYARRGQVISLDIKEGQVKASVQGSAKKPYSVTIEMQTIALESWLELAHSSFNQALIVAQLLSGTMPENSEKLFQEKGLNLFPLRKDDLKTSCSCPDHSNPCKHIAAVYLLLGEEFDREPFLIFRLRGMSRVKLLRIIFAALEVSKKLSKSLESVETDAGENAAGQEADGTTETPHDSLAEAQTLTPAPEFLPQHAALFWIDSSNNSLPVPPAKRPQSTAQLLKTIGSPPFWRANENFLEAMTKIYDTASSYAERLLVDDYDQ